MRISELLTVGYFVTILALAWLRPIEPRARLHASISCLGTITVIFILVNLPETRPVTVARDWAPIFYLLLAYLVPSDLVVSVHCPLERALIDADRWLFDRGLRRLVTGSPRWVLEWFELTYVAVYPMVPAGFALFYFGAHPVTAERFWVPVLAAEYVCYGLLPLMATRPPWAVGCIVLPTRELTTRRLNQWIVRWLSNRWNTFPSGHAAGALTIALVVWQSQPIVGVVFLLLALSISIASVVGRYHYAADVAAGMGLALVVLAVAP